MSVAFSAFSAASTSTTPNQRSFVPLTSARSARYCHFQPRSRCWRGVERCCLLHRTSGTLNARGASATALLQRRWCSERGNGEILLISWLISVTEERGWLMGDRDQVPRHACACHKQCRHHQVALPSHGPLAATVAPNVERLKRKERHGWTDTLCFPGEALGSPSSFSVHLGS